MQVRSDFKVSLKLKDANGQVHDLGSYDAETTAAEGEQQSRPVPHLQRLSPDQRWLASFDADQMRLDLRAVDTSRAGERGAIDKPLLVNINGVAGTVHQFRWLKSINGFSISTDKNLYILPFDPDAGERSVQAQPVFDPEQIGAFAIADTRILPDGMLVRTREFVNGDPYWYRGEVYWVRLGDGTVQDLVPLVPDHLTAVAANVRSNGRIVLALAVHDYDRAESQGQGDLSELWTVETDPVEPPTVTEKRACADESCNVGNWAPGTDRLTYALEWDDKIIIEGSSPDDDDIELQWSEENYASTHTLWQNADQTRVLAATLEGLQLWDANGTALWDWTPKSKEHIHSAHFEDDGSIVVAAGTKLYRLTEGKAKRVLRTRGKYKPRRTAGDGEGYDAWGETTKDSFVDDAITLPGGAVAFSVVDVEESYEEMGWEEPPAAAQLQGLEQQKAPDQKQRS